MAVDAVDTVEDTDERTDMLEGVRFAAGGDNDNFLLSAGEGGGRLPFVVETLEAVESALARTTFCDDPVAVDLTLVEEAVDITLERAAELGVMSDFAVSKFVEPSLVVDIVELGLERPEGGRREEGPATVLRIVGTCDLVDFIEATEDRKREDASLADVVEVKCLRGVGVLGVGIELAVESRVDSRIEVREEESDGVVCPGVSFESGLAVDTLIVLRVAVVARDAVE